MIGRILTQPDDAHWPRTAAAFAGAVRAGLRRIEELLDEQPE
jgi:hypothetical protein